MSSLLIAMAFPSIESLFSEVMNPSNLWLLAQTATVDAEAPSDWKSFLNIGLFLIAVIVPFVLGKFFSKQLKMPNHALGFSWILLAIICTAIVLTTGQLKLGPDIKGGTNLIYQIQQPEVEDGGYRANAKDFIAPLQKRINLSGLNESVVRPAGNDKIEVIIADIDPNEIKDIKNKITSAGVLQFRIVANQNDHEELIRAAKAQSENPNVEERLRRDVMLENKTTGAMEVAGIWRPLERPDEQSDSQEIQGYSAGDTIRNARTGELLNPVLTGRPNDFEFWLASQKIQDVDILLALQKNGVPYKTVDGKDLSRAKVEISKNGGYLVSFVMKTAGAEIGRAHV